MEEMVYDIYVGQDAMLPHKPFDDLKKINDKLVRERAYHSQVVMEFYLLNDAISMMKDKWISQPFIKDFLYMALISQRTAEFALVSYQMSVGLLGIKMDSKENLLMLGLCLFATKVYLENMLEERNMVRNVAYRQVRSRRRLT